MKAKLIKRIARRHYSEEIQQAMLRHPHPSYVNPFKRFYRIMKRNLKGEK